MKKKIFLILTLGAVFINCLPSLAENPSILINGEEVHSDVEAKIYNSVTYLPLRAVFEGLGATVFFDDESKSIMAYKEDTMVYMRIGDESMRIYKNSELSQEKKIAAPFIENSRTLAPVRYAAEAFGYSVEWDEENKKVYIYNEDMLPETTTKTTTETTTETTTITATTIETTTESTTVATTQSTTYPVIGNKNKKKALPDLVTGSGHIRVAEKNNLEIELEIMEGDIVYHTDEAKSTYTNNRVELPIDLTAEYESPAGGIIDNKIIIAYNYYDEENRYLGTGTIELENMQEGQPIEIHDAIYIHRNTAFIYWHLRNYVK